MDSNSAVIRESIALVWFAALQPELKVASIGGNDGRMGMSNRPSAVVTVLEMIETPDGSPLPEVVGVDSNGGPILQPGRHRYRPSFWSSRECIERILHFMGTQVDDPNLWVMGEYEGGWGRTGPGPSAAMNSELYDLVRLGRIGHRYFEKAGASHRGLVPVLFCQEPRDPVPLPYNQGFGHSSGVRVAAVPGSLDPCGIVRHLTERMFEGSDYEVPSFVTSDDVVPDVSQAWICPFGIENREHACITVDGMSAVEIANQVASAVGLPLLRTECSSEEFSKWDWDQTVPADMLARLAKG